MNPWDLACTVRFQAFPFIEDALKRRPIRCILEMDVQHQGFQAMIKPSLEFNQFTRFCKQLNQVRHKRYIYVPVPVEKDIELIESLFWEEQNEALAKRILQTLLTFPTYRHPTVWRSGTNLLMRATQPADKEAALAFLEVFSGV